MTDSVQSIETLAKRFFDAIEAGDIAAMRASLADDAAIWHNTDELVVTPDQTAQTLTGMVQRITDIHYADRRLTAFPGGFVQQHVLTGKRRLPGFDNVGAYGNTPNNGGACTTVKPGECHSPLHLFIYYNSLLITYNS